MSIEDVIEYWDNRPCNIQHSNKSIGTKAYFLGVSNRKYIVEPHILTFANFKQWANKSVLEVGCGIGTAAHNFIINGANYKGIDISNMSLDIAKQRLKIFNLNGIIEHANIETYIDDKQYDLIYSFGVLHHTPNIQKSIDNIYNLLCNGGTFKLMLYAKRSWKYYRIMDGLDQYEAQNNVPIANVYTKEDVYSLLKQFNNIDIQQKHIFPYKIKEYKQYEYIKEDYFNAMPNKLFNCLEKNLGWHLCITCIK